MSVSSILILTTQPWLQVTRLALRLVEYGARVSAICPDESHLPHAPGIARRFRYRLANPLGSVRHAIKASGAHYLVPADDLAVWFLHELAETDPALRPLIERSLGPIASQPVQRSRFKLLALAHQLGVSVPQTELIGGSADLHRWCTAHPEGFVLKKDGTWGGRGVELVQGSEEAHEAYARLQKPAAWSERAAQWLRAGDGSAFARLRCLGQPEITAQTLVRGVPANSMYACREGKILGEVQARVAASKGQTGPSLVVQLIKDPSITRAGTELASALGLSGFFGLDFILDAHTGKPYLLEMNPRSTQLGHIAVAGQADLVGLMWAQWTGTPVPANADPQLSPAVWFYPDAETWTHDTASFPGCRPDMQPNEREGLTRLIEQKKVRGGLRKLACNSASLFRGAFSNEAILQPFYFQSLGHREKTEEPARRAPVISFAS